MSAQNNNFKLVVGYSDGKGYVYSVRRIGDAFIVSVDDWDALGRYKVIDVISCENEAEARHTAWDYSMGGYKHD